jgi:hypothetical protein
MSPQRKLFVALIGVFAGMTAVLAAGAAAGGKTWHEPSLGAASGSAIGPGGALFVPQPVQGKVYRVDPDTGETTLFASGLPQRLAALPFGGVMDVAFAGSTAYALVTVVGNPFACDSQSIGLYRIDGPTSSSMIADIGAYSCANAPPTAFLLPTGVQYALEPFRGGFLVTDGHHNRVLRVGVDGTVTQMIQFGDIVPTGLAARGNTIYMAEAGPVPHLPDTGKVVSLTPGSSTADTVATGARLAVDVELGRGQTLFALSQGHFTCLHPDFPNSSNCPGDAGSPADENTGTLMRANANGTFDVVKGGLNRPSSLEIIGNTAYVITLGGDVVRIDDIASPPYG